MRAQLASKNTGLSLFTCEQIVKNGGDNITFTEDCSSVVFPMSLVIITTNEGGAIFNKTQKIDVADIDLFVSIAHKNEICINILLDGFNSVTVTLLKRYREMSKKELAEYLKTAEPHLEKCERGTVQPSKEKELKDLLYKERALIHNLILDAHTQFPTMGYDKIAQRILSLITIS